MAAPAQRIVSLAPYLTELLYAAGAGGAIVGVSAFSDYPPAARGIERIGSGTGLDLERILALRPDLVVIRLGTCNLPSDDGRVKMTVRVLGKMGLPLVVLCGPMNLSNSRDRAEGTKAELAAHGIRVDPRDVPAIRAGLARLAGDRELRRRLAAAGRERHLDIEAGGRGSLLHSDATRQHDHVGQAGTAIGRDTLEHA